MSPSWSRGTLSTPMASAKVRATQPSSDSSPSSAGGGGCGRRGAGPRPRRLGAWNRDGAVLERSGWRPAPWRQPRGQAVPLPACGPPRAGPAAATSSCDTTVGTSVGRPPSRRRWKGRRGPVREAVRQPERGLLRPGRARHRAGTPTRPRRIPLRGGRHRRTGGRLPDHPPTRAFQPRRPGVPWEDLGQANRYRGI